MFWSIVLSSVLALFLSFVLFDIGGPKSIVESPDREYDYIVVGAGTAGCVIASRLAEQPKVKVLLVEAGDTIQFFSRIPLLAPAVQMTNADWQYKSVSQRFSSEGLVDNVQFLPRGRGLGGSGHINYMLHSFGRANDYSNWLEGWRHRELEPYFAEVEELMTVNRQFADKLLARAMRLYEKATAPFVRASMTTSGGTRASTYRTHLQKVWQRSNLHILIDAHVHKVLIGRNEIARGVELSFNDHVKNVSARKEVILCAGAIGSPQILMLSGVGSRKELQKHKIPVKVHLPSVGRHLFDHVNMPMYVKFNDPPPKGVSITQEKLLTLATLTDYLFEGTGLLASNGIIGMVQGHNYSVILTAFGTIEKNALMRLSNYQDRVFEGLFPTHNDSKTEGYLILTTCLQPQSRGRLNLRSSDPNDHPLIDPNYLNKVEDVACHFDAMKKAKEIANSVAFAEYGAELNVPWFEECRHFRQDFDDLDYSSCALRVGAITSHHPAGTCRMGIDKYTSVVNEKLQVHDIKKLRVVDASVLPNPISGPPNSVIIAIAEKAAEMILKEAA